MCKRGSLVSKEMIDVRVHDHNKAPKSCASVHPGRMEASMHASTQIMHAHVHTLTGVREHPRGNILDVNTFPVTKAGFP